jgi:hypothetical protein
LAAQGPQELTITAADPLPDDLRDALNAINESRGVRTDLSYATLQSLRILGGGTLGIRHTVVRFAGCLA